MFIDAFTSLPLPIVAIAGICLIDLCYIFVIHTQQDATQRNKKQQKNYCWTSLSLCGPSNSKGKKMTGFYQRFLLVFLYFEK
jgi:hypothetical protein